MSFDKQQLYELLPAIYRIRDAEQGEPLKALLSVIANEIAVLDEDLEQLYDDQFIETCAEWVIPYIGDLIGYRLLHGVTPEMKSMRSEVANTIAYRRRKGTAAVLEQLAKDVTGLNARVVEFFQILATTQYMNHLRLNNLYSPDMRNSDILEYLDTPFDRVTHTLDVRNIKSRRGWYNIHNIGIFLWRLQAYPITRGTAKKVNDGCYTFNPLGIDAMLFNKEKSEDEITHIAEPVNVPEPLHRRVLYNELEAMRQALADGISEDVVTKENVYFGKKPVLEVFKDGTLIPAKDILICDLSDWHRPSDTKLYGPYHEPFTIQAAVDPVLGRLTFPSSSSLDDVTIEVNYAYGFSADLGGGEYPRSNLEVATSTVSEGGLTLSDALAGIGVSGNHVIEINSSATIDGDLLITLNAKQHLTIQAKDEKRPVINGSITIDSADDIEITLDGLLIGGHIQVNETAPVKLTLHHCTISPWLNLDSLGKPEFPAIPSIAWVEKASTGKLILDHTISGRVIVADGIQVEVNNGIIDALNDNSVALAASDEETLPAGNIKIHCSTVIGTVSVREITIAQNSIFSGPVSTQRTQKGCVRFCYLPSGSKVPLRYQCQPDMAIKQAIDSAIKDKPDLSPVEKDQIASEIRLWMKSGFTARYYGRPGYAQLRLSSPMEIRSGAEDGSEMGVFHDLYQIQYEINLRVRMDEYLRFGLEAGFFYST
jgi:hypothetical protein